MAKHDLGTVCLSTLEDLSMIGKSFDSFSIRMTTSKMFGRMLLIRVFADTLDPEIEEFDPTPFGVVLRSDHMDMDEDLDPDMSYNDMDGTRESVCHQYKLDCGTYTITHGEVSVTMTVVEDVPESNRSFYNELLSFVDPPAIQKVRAAFNALRDLSVKEFGNTFAVDSLFHKAMISPVEPFPLAKVKDLMHTSDKN